ncbi:hypothetical protein MFIFM68171_09380 [Madurella fahalii]|uniref:CENP-V/GFA domain-containing protein n=1 Tax=Madurella fahalii TaxID=1157608 RepID=A0ABQ0GNQ5_9PEZI
MSHPFPTPKSITGGCLCNALRYRADFPADHNFETGSSTCQCTQCRKQTGSLFFSYQTVTPSAAFQWISPSTSTLKLYQASPMAERAFCGDCGSFIYWKAKDSDRVSFTLGTVDPLYLFGEGADGKEVPEGGFGMALANGGGEHSWCKNEIKGVTDEASLGFMKKGTRTEE